MKLLLLLLLLGAEVTHSAAADTGSCVGRCGEGFNRGRKCACDLGCLQHNKCCQDFEATCTTAQSCKGRCGETFRRGQRCECDPQCIHYNTCCHDYRQHCDAGMLYPHPKAQRTQRAGASKKCRAQRGKKSSNSESEELYSGVRKIPTGILPISSPSLYGGTQDFLASGSSQGSNAPTIPLTLGADGGVITDDFLCSDSPISGLTALINGTMLIFKGPLFWSVNPINRSVTGPQSILGILGVPSPIDTVFTRCNCEPKTYIIKGEQYWLLDKNMVMEPGYPRPLTSEFPGLRGPITAALAVPATGGSPEAVYFFRKGDVMQRFTFSAGSIPLCSQRPGHPQPAEASLSKEINLRLESLMGFPLPVTSALSMPSPQLSDPFQHYVLSGVLFFNVKISGNMPALVKPDPTAPFASLASPVGPNPANPATLSIDRLHRVNSIRVWLQCP